MKIFIIGYFGKYLVSMFEGFDNLVGFWLGKVKLSAIEFFIKGRIIPRDFNFETNALNVVTQVVSNRPEELM